MRITNSQKSQLNKILEEVGVNQDQFEYTGQDEMYQVKFKDNFFTFHIKMEDPTKFINTISYVNTKTPHVLRQTWADTIIQFKHWAKGIADDVKFTPKSFTDAGNLFPIEISKYSKAFIGIYNQALTAEANKLEEICGLGYRKAFEFLIKDYLLKKHPKVEHAKIKEMQLSPCINQYITDDKIKLVATRVLWLGNDHAHYLKKWKGKTLADLKYLIDLTIKWILIKDELSKVERAMPKSNKH